MDASLTSRLLTELLPPDLADSVRQHLLNPAAPFQIYKQRALEFVTPYLQPLADGLLALVLDNQGVTGFLVLLALMTAVVVVMNWVRRLVLWWTRLVMRAMFWSLLVVLAAWVWNRGVLESARDGTVVLSKVVGYLAVLKDFWLAEYSRYEGQERGRTPLGSGSGRYSGR